MIVRIATEMRNAIRIDIKISNYTNMRVKSIEIKGNFKRNISKYFTAFKLITP